MIKVFLDTNVLLDTMLPNRKYTVESQLILGFAAFFRLCVSPQSFPDMSYISRTYLDAERLRKRFQYFCNHLYLLPLSAECVDYALKSNCPDFEDAMQIACAHENDCEIIVTGDKKHFANYTDIPVYTPGDFLEKMQANGESRLTPSASCI